MFYFLIHAHPTVLLADGNSSKGESWLNAPSTWSGAHPLLAKLVLYILLFVPYSVRVSIVYFEER